MSDLSLRDFITETDEAYYCINCSYMLCDKMCAESGCKIYWSAKAKFDNWLDDIIKKGDTRNV